MSSILSRILSSVQDVEDADGEARSMVLAGEEVSCPPKKYHRNDDSGFPCLDYHLLPEWMSNALLLFAMIFESNQCVLHLLLKATWYLDTFVVLRP